MSKLHILLLALAVSVVSPLAWADSPLTSTDLHRAYPDVAQVEHAAKALLDLPTFDKLRAPSTSYEIRAAIISAIGWQGGGKSNAPAVYRAFLKKATGKAEPAGPVDWFNLGILTVMADYQHPKAGLVLLDQVASIETGDQAVQMVRVLVKAQAGMDEANGWCEIWRAVDAVRTGTYKKPMRRAAVARIVGTMRLYKNSCKAEDSVGSEKPQPSTDNPPGHLTVRPDTRLRGAASRGDVAEMSVLLKGGAAVDQRFDLGETALMAAAGKGRADAVKFLLDAHASIDLVDERGRSALSRAAAAKSLAVVELLLARGAKTDVKNGRGAAPLFEAAMAGDAGIVRLLLAKGADPMPRDDQSGDTAFMRAASGGYTDVLRVLAGGADVNARNLKGETALMHAARNGRMSAVDFLLGHGAEVAAHDNSGMSAAAMARHNGHTFVAEALEKRGAVLAADEKTEVTTVVSARNQQRFFSDSSVEHCKIEHAGRKSFEVCAESNPAGRGRRFSLTLRDPSALEMGVSVQTTKHRLVVEVEIPAKPDEYLDLEWVQWFDWVDTKHLVLVPIVHGVPGEYDHARSSLYVFDDQTRKISRVWDSPRCGPPCEGQLLQLGGKRGEAAPTVIYQQKVGGQTLETRLGWNGSAIVSKP